MAVKPRTEESFDPAHIPEKPVKNLKPYGIGIDTHKRFIQVCVLIHSAHCEAGSGGGGGLLQSEHEFSTDWSDLTAAKQWALDRLHRRGLHVHPEKIEYTIESTGTYHSPVLRAWGGQPSVVNPLLAQPSRRKTDVLDARLLAQHALIGLWPSSFVPSDQLQTLRLLFAERRELQRLALRSTNRIENIVLRYGHTFLAQCSVRDIAGEGTLDELLRWSEGAIARPDLPGLSETPLPIEVCSIVRNLWTTYRDSSERMKLRERDALAYALSHEWPVADGTMSGKQLFALLQTVPGVGKITSLTWLSEIGDPTRFAGAKQVAAFCGCDPSLKVSAGKVTSHTRRRGNTRLHKALVQAAAVLIRQGKEPLGLWGSSIQGRHKKGGWKKATGAVARRLAASLWHVHSRGEEFSYEQYQFYVPPRVPFMHVREMLSPKVAAIMERIGLKHSVEVTNAFYQDLGRKPGVGTKTMQEIKEWVDKHGSRTFEASPPPRKVPSCNPQPEVEAPASS